MAKIIKKGKCEYKPLPVPPSDEGSEEVEQEQEGAFSSLSVVIEADFQERDKQPPEAKGQEAEPVRPSHDPVGEASTQAEAILEEARKEAERIRAEAEESLREAQRRGEEIESQAYSIGYDQGKKDGEEIGRKQYQAVAQRLEKLLESISVGAEALLPQYESQMVEVAMGAARQIIHRELSISRDIVLESIRAAMEQVVEGSAVHLHMNPADIEALEDEIRERFAMPGRNGLEIVSDPRIDRGGCLIETEYGLIDATIRAKWQAVSDTIKRILAERTGTLPDKRKSKDGSEASVQGPPEEQVASRGHAPDSQQPGGTGKGESDTGHAELNEN